MTEFAEAKEKIANYIQKVKPNTNESIGPVSRCSYDSAIEDAMAIVDNAKRHAITHVNSRKLINEILDGMLNQESENHKKFIEEGHNEVRDYLEIAAFGIISTICDNHQGEYPELEIFFVRIVEKLTGEK